MPLAPFPVVDRNFRRKVEDFAFEINPPWSVSFQGIDDPSVLTFAPDVSRSCPDLADAFSGPDSFWLDVGNEISVEPSGFVLLGGKWGPSSTFGTSGRTVTWSIADGGLTNGTGSPTFFTGATAALSDFLGFDYSSVLVQAFAAWSAVADIDFVQVADGGGNIGAGASGYIRLCGGFIDGAPGGSNVLARAFGPSGAGNAQNFAISGDVVFDSAQGAFWTAESFLAVATHEIGHALGLNHTSVGASLMNASYSPAIVTPQADDIAGLQAIYGLRNGNVGTIAIADVTINERNSGTSFVSFTVTRTGGFDAFVVDFATADGAAIAGSDYVANAGTLTFGAGVTSRTVTVSINGDALIESDETFFVNLSSASNGGVIADGQGVGAIVNDDFIDDFTATTATTGRLAVGGSAVGRIGSDGDHDWFRVDLTAGRAYTFRLNGVGHASGTLSNPSLRLLGSSGLLLASSTGGGGGGFDSLLSYTATSTGAHYVDAGGLFDAFTGTYTVSVMREAGALRNDLGGDGVAEVLWQNVSGLSAVWQINSLGGLNTALLPNPGPGWKLIGAGDFYLQDRMADLLWQNTSDSSVAVWRMNGSTLVAGAQVAAPGVSWHAVATGDFNRDGTADVALQHDNGEVAVWILNGSTITGGGSLGGPDVTWRLKATGDFDADGASDLLFRNDDGSVAVWRMDGLSAIASPSIGNPGADWNVRGVGDFNRDGHSDIVWQHDGGAVAVWSMQDASTALAGPTTGIVAAPGADWVVAAVADYDGNSVADIMLQNVNTGQAALWSMNGTNLSPAGLLLAANPGTAWHMVA